MRWPNRYSPIGLDLGSHAFKAVQLRGDAVASSVVLPRVKAGEALSGDEMRRIAGVLDRRGFVGQDVVLAVPAAGLLTSILELPARAPGVPLEQIALAEFGRVNRVEPATLTLSTWELPPPVRARGTYMLAVGAASATLESYIDVVESAGLNAVAVEEPFSAAGRGALHTAGPATPAEGLATVVDLGFSAASVVVLHCGTVVYNRKLADAGMNRAVRAAADVAGCDVADMEFALAHGDAELLGSAEISAAFSGHFAEALKEIARAIDYAVHQYSGVTMQRAVLVGGGAGVPGAAEQFHATLNVPAMPPAAVSPQLAPALGLALFAEGGQ